MGRLWKGLAAGAVGTELLNITTYLDMALRGRGASSVPEQDVDKLLDRVGVSLDDDNRKGAVATLLGYATGASIGTTYAMLRPALRWLPTPVAAAAVGLGAMAATDASSAALGTTDPRTWSATDWLSDIIPHLAYGAGVVLTYDALD
jgi:pimeloyl-ACP methyl ester carboxylesterase